MEYHLYDIPYIPDSVDLAGHFKNAKHTISNYKVHTWKNNKQLHVRIRKYK